MKKRITQLLSKAEQLGVDAFLLHDSSNIRYFSGYTGEGSLFVAPQESAVITDFRYTEQAAGQAPECSVCETSGGNDAQIAASLAEKYGVRRLGVELNVLSYSAYCTLREAMPECELISIGSTGVDIRAIKDENEIALIREACRITDLTFNDMLTWLKPGMEERDVALEMNYRIAKLGSEGPSFSFIIASGPNASMPHAIPGRRKIAVGDVVTFDFGCKVGGYCSDMTRTIAIGDIGDEMKKVYQIVLDAHLRVLEGLRPGITGKQADALARDYIASHGYGDRFGHGTGHGVGLQIHEQPRLSVKGEDELKAGMVVTDEPGIYLPGLGGVRIEDTCLITNAGAEALFTAPKSLVIL